MTKKNIKIIIGIFASIFLFSSSVFAATTIIASNEVSYTSNGNSTVQGALDDLYTKAKLKNMGNFIVAYTYNASTCVTGNESTCVTTTCYKTKSANACPAGTIIKYKVRPGEVKTFHVMYDDANTITMQSQRNTVYSTGWISGLDYSGSTTYANDKGPLTQLLALESATAGWVNVNDQTYTMGTTTFKTNAYTGCSAYNSCTTNKYTLASRTAKARMITLQEAALLGCTESNQSCPKWMYNYLIYSTTYGGTENDTSVGTKGSYNYGYYTMNANSSTTTRVWALTASGGRLVNNIDTDYINYSSRAVVVVNKP